MLKSLLHYPIRQDVVTRTYNLISRNLLQPHGVKFSYHPSGAKAGHNNASASWGTGRAKARVPRVHGSGTNRAGQAAVANFARKGHMFSPVVTWRRWHRFVNRKERNIAVMSCLSASSLAAMVQARGHVLPEGKSLPLVIPSEKLAAAVNAAGNSSGSSSGSGEARGALEGLGLGEELRRCREGRARKKARSRLRNRNYRRVSGPLVIHDSSGEEAGRVKRAFGALEGVSVMSVHSLNLKRLAPGGNVGRMVVWTEGALESMDRRVEGLKGKGELGEFRGKRILGKEDVREILECKDVKGKLDKKESLISKVCKVTTFRNGVKGK